MEDLTSLARFVAKNGKGVWVQASTLGSLEALLTFLKQMEIPVFNFGIGPIYKNTIVRSATMLDKAPEYAVILAFDVVIEKEAAELAQKAGLKVFSGERSTCFLGRGTVCLSYSYDHLSPVRCLQKVYDGSHRSETISGHAKCCLAMSNQDYTGFRSS